MQSKGGYMTPQTAGGKQGLLGTSTDAHHPHRMWEHIIRCLVQAPHADSPMVGKWVLHVKVNSNKQNKSNPKIFMSKVRPGNP